MTVNIKREPSLENTFSGVAAESKVAAELLRFGFRVAKPLWTNNEADLIVLYPLEGAVFPIPVQVKSVQFLDSKSEKHWDTRYMGKLKKRYVEDNPALCLAIYRPDLDRIWFIDGPENIKTVHNKHARKRYDDLDKKSNLSIRLTYEDCPLDEDWLAPKDNGKWWSDRLFRLASSLAAANRLTAQVEEFFDLIPEDEESDEESRDAAGSSGDLHQ